MRTFKVKLIVNGTSASWASWPAKIAAMKAFYQPVCNLDITFQKANFPVVPMLKQPGQVTVFGPMGYQDTVGTDIYVDPNWRVKNIVPLGFGYDICMFQNNTEWQLGMPQGIFTGNGQIDTYLQRESDHTYLNVGGVEKDLGDAVSLVLIHELSHAFYGIVGKTDRTHEHFYSGFPERVLNDFVFPSTAAQAYAMILVLLAEWRDLLLKKKSQ